MLISQRIANNQKFLQNPASISDKRLNDIRQRILKSTKFLVERSLWNFNDQTETVTFKQNKTRNDDFSAAALKKSEENKKRYEEFARPPFDSITIENETGLALVQRISKNKFVIDFVSSKGQIMLGTVHVDEDEKILEVKDLKDREVLLSFRRAGYDAAYISEILTAAQELAALQADFLMEVLVYLNISNIQYELYKPSNKESNGIAKTFRPFYEYRIINLYREKKAYKCLEDVETDINSVLDPDRRAHLVRGHFKRINGKLYWWNPFMRNRKNLETHGFIQKDYHVH